MQAHLLALAHQRAIEVLHLAGCIVVEVGEGGRHRRSSVNRLLQEVAHAELVVLHLVCIPEAVALDVLLTACLVNLRQEVLAADGKFRCRSTVGCSIKASFDALADIELAGRRDVLGPPAAKRGVVGSFMANLPIELGNHVVDPSRLCPKQHVGIKVVVALRTVGLRTSLPALLVAVDAEGTDAEAHPWFDGADVVVYRLDKDVHAATTEVAQIGTTVRIEAHLRSISLEGGDVVELLAGHRIRIEVVVHVDGIHVVTLHDVDHHRANPRTAFGQSRIEVEPFVKDDEILGMQPVEVIARQVEVLRHIHAVRIDPGVELHATIVTKADQVFHRVPFRLWCLALLTRQETAPGLIAAAIERITFRSRLEDDGIEACLI